MKDVILAFLVGLVVWMPIFLINRTTKSPISPLATYQTIDATGGNCSSVAIRQVGSRGFFLTAKHCLPAVRVGEWPVLEIHPFDAPDVDLALVVADVGAETLRITPMAAQEPSPGDVLYVVGFQYGEPPIATQGYQGAEKGSMSADVFYGASGGPVVDGRGHLVGIVKAMYPGATHISFYTPVLEHRGWISRLCL